MRRALIDPNGVTRNIILIDIPASYPLAAGWSLGDPEANPMPIEAPSVPGSVSPRQMKLALLNAGMLDAVESFVARAPREVQIAWEYATEWQRGNALLNQMAQAFGLTEDKLDDLFVAAAAQ
jgi:hypothetical protein